MRNSTKKKLSVIIATIAQKKPVEFFALGAQHQKFYYNIIKNFSSIFFSRKICETDRNEISRKVLNFISSEQCKIFGDYQAFIAFKWILALIKKKIQLFDTPGILFCKYSLINILKFSFTIIQRKNKFNIYYLHCTLYTCIDCTLYMKRMYHMKIYIIHSS